MCGFTGFLTFSQQTHQQLEAIVSKMNDTLISRGPDSAGTWVDARQGVALGHRRLAIQDLSPAGHQPMLSASGRYVMAFNGEIYNHLELRNTLALNAVYNWNGHSDTETILACIEAWGLEVTLSKLTGMFAIALWDKETAQLSICRDRLGEKPLYYGFQNKQFIFGSELKALKQHPGFIGDIDRNALALYLQHLCVPAPYSIYQDINKVLPGELVTVNNDGSIDKLMYWQGEQVACMGIQSQFQGTAKQAVDKLEECMLSAVGKQMLADVPLGAFLSGGVDSSSIVALMQAQSDKPIKTFTIGFNEAGYNEAEHAKLVAGHLGTEHTELYIDTHQAQDLIPSLPRFYDEPFADSSQLPTLLISQLASQHVTVALSGDGGDELFAGYNRHKTAHKVLPKLAHLPVNIRKFIAKGLISLSPMQWEQLQKVLPKKYQQSLLGDKVQKAASVIGSTNRNELYQGLVSIWPAAHHVVIGASGVESRSFMLAEKLTELSDTELMMALDMLTYMPDDILTKVDRASMAYSLETRVPFLDHHLVEFAWKLPLKYKLRDGQSKWALRQVLYRHVPNELIDRPKMGFAVPIAEWLRGPLRNWAESLLDEKRLAIEGYFDPQIIRETWQLHLSGKRNCQHQLWAILMFQQWLEQEKPTC